MAEDTVEERIYRLLEEKLLEIARTIGKVDPVTGEVVEDFRSEILGFLGTSPNYQDLYKKALVDRDYKRTEREMVEAIERKIWTPSTWTTTEPFEGTSLLTT